FSSRRRHTRFSRDWSSDVCSSDLVFSPGNKYKFSKSNRSMPDFFIRCTSLSMNFLNSLMSFSVMFKSFNETFTNLELSIISTVCSMLSAFISEVARDRYFEELDFLSTTNLSPFLMYDLNKLRSEERRVG